MDRLWDSIEEFLSEERVELDDLELSGRTLRVVVDAEDGLDLDHISEVSHGVSRLLDGQDDFLGGSYNLEVTSPGLERKLRRPRHFEKSIGREVVVKTIRGERVRGLLLEAGPESFTVQSGAAEQRLRYDEVSSARTVFTLPTNPKPGKKK